MPYRDCYELRDTVTQHFNTLAYCIPEEGFMQNIFRAMSLGFDSW